MFRPCRYVTKPCNLGLLATCSGKHAYKKTETSVPFGPFVKETSHHFTPVSEAPLSPSPFDAALPLRMSCGHAAGAWPARCHTICDASHSLPFRRPALFHGPPPSTQFWAPGVGGTGGSPYNNIYILYHQISNLSSLLSSPTRRSCRSYLSVSSPRNGDNSPNMANKC